MVSAFLRAFTLPKSVNVAIFIATAAVLEPWLYEPTLLNNVDDHWILLLHFALIYSGAMCIIWFIQYLSSATPKVVNWMSTELTILMVNKDGLRIIEILSKNPDSQELLKNIYAFLGKDFEKITVSDICNRLEKKGLVHIMHGSPKMISLTELGVRAAERYRRKKQATA